MTRQMIELTDVELESMIGGATVVQTATTLVETATATDVDGVTTTVTRIIQINRG